MAKKTLREVCRVLKAEGSFNRLASEVFPGHRMSNVSHSSERLRDNNKSRILSLIGEAGFSDHKGCEDDSTVIACSGLRILPFCHLSIE
jgi:hypothetical protein